MNDDDDELPAILAIRDIGPNDDLPPLELKTERANYLDVCKHRRSFVNREARTLTCQDCGVALDPIEKLYNLAVYGQNLDSRVAIIRADEKRARETAERLASEARKGLPAKMARIAVGDYVTLWPLRGSYVRGKVARPIENDVIAIYGWNGSHVEEFKFSEVKDVRIRRKAKTA